MTPLPKIARMSRVIAFLSATGVLSACAAISAVNDVTTPLDVYELRAPQSIQSTSRRALQRDVIVELPTTSGALATDRIMIRPTPLQAQYLPDVRWGEATPVMVQTLMLRSIEQSGVVRYVGRKPLGSSGDFALVTEVVDFQAELSEDGEAATVRLNMIVRVVREQDARVIASRTFVANAAAPSTETDAIVQTFNTAADEVFSDFAAWLPGVLTGL